MGPARAVAGAQFDFSLTTERTCSPAATMSSIVTAFGNDLDALYLLATENRNIVANLIPSSVTVTLPTGKTLAPITNGMSQVCTYAPVEQRLSFQNRTFPAEYIQAYADVLQYRQSHPWIYGPADMTAPDAQVIIERYPPNYVIVSLADYVRHVDGHGGVILISCAFSEQYRFSLQPRQVLPFDLCVEPHKPQLPSFGALP